MKADLYNNYPKGFLEKFDKPVTFRLVGIKKDPDNPKRFLYPGFRDIPLKDAVVFTTPDGEKHRVSIAYIKSVTAEGQAVLGVGDIGFGVFNHGQIRLNPDSPRDRLMFEYMNHCNYNESNPNRDRSIKAVFYKLDLEKDAEARRSDRKLKIQAAGEIKDLSKGALITMFDLLFPGKNTGKLSFEEMADQVENEAFKDPQKFLDTLEESRDQFKVLAKEAVQAKVLVNDQKKRTFAFKDSDHPLLKYTASQFSYDELAAMLMNDQELFQKIKTLVGLSAK